nr:MAG TPA: hypothetical protein [Caudoviricetes sp.]
MTLTTSDYMTIASQIEEGKGSVEFEKDNEILFFDYSYEIEGYVEDDYFNGTGAFVKTSSSLCIEGVESFNEDGEQTSNNFNESELEKMIA